ncbi:MAG: hypothetical protein DI627_05780 [Acinetobacter sp.]|uniref:hypothetical protein n=1 Tax=Acinetobacter sp. TaxID=472 RepID=UPI000DB29279|nr:hypothetical protein [Acinetobacter sp.]PZT87754.1 MAG: hypothetical protein DI627_05780 [Acinetobacter sp.]
MSAKLGTLTLDLVAKTGRYTEPLKNAEQATKKSVAGMTSTISTLKGAWGVAGVALSAATGLMATKLVAVQREFDVLNAGLITATKSSKDAKIAFDALSQFAKETPYGLSQAVEAFNKLVNLGLTPSEQALMSYGNTASAMGKDLMQLIEAVADASTFEFERLKEFGIKSKQEGDKVKFTFQGVTTEVKKNASDIEQYLIKLGENQFAGAMSERMNTLDGDVAGLEDSWNSLWLSVSQSGVGDLIRVGIQEASASIDDLTDIVKSGAIETALSGMGKAFNIFSNGAQDDINSIGVNFSELSKHLIQVWQSTVNELNAIGNALNIGKSWVQKATVGLAAGWDIITDPFNKASSNSSKQAAFESSMIAIDEELIAKKDAVSKAFKNAEKQLAAFNTKTKEGRDVLADYKVKTQDSAKETENDTKKKKEAAKAQAQLNRTLEEQARIRNSLIYEFSDKQNRMRLDYQSVVTDIGKAGLDSKDYSDFLTMAKERYKAEQELYLAEQQFELNQHKYTEKQKLDEEFRLNNLRLNAQIQMKDDEYKEHIKSLTEKHTQELAWLELEKQQRLLDARQFYMSDAEYMQERYQLERDEIAKNMQLSQQERDARIAMLHAEEEFEKRKNLKSASIAWGQSYADMTGSGARFQIEQDRFNRYEESNALFESQIALAETAAEREAIWQAHHERMTAIESAYQQGSYGLQLGYGEQVTGALSNMLGTMLGESSSTYQALFYAQRSFALAQAGMNVWKAASDAYANEPGTVWQKMGAAALATIESGTFVSMIKAATPVGMAHNGIDNIPKEGTWLLDGGERVLNPQQNQDLTRYLNERQSGSGGGDVGIQVNVTDSGVTTSGGNTQDQKQLGQLIGNAVRAVIRQEQRQGGLLAK